MTKLGIMTAATECAASISYDTALAILAAHAAPLDVVCLPIADAGGCHLAEPIYARLDSPRFGCAAMDGYAVREPVLADGFAALRQIGISCTESGDAGEIGVLETMRVMTDAPLPRSADRVIMIKYCRQKSDSVRIGSAPTGKPHIRRQGSDFAAGQFLIRTAAKVTPAVAITAAAGDHHQLPVSRHPTVQLIATGDEIVPPGSAVDNSMAVPDSLSAAIDQ